MRRKREREEEGAREEEERRMEDGHSGQDERVRWAHCRSAGREILVVIVTKTKTVAMTKTAAANPEV